MSSWFPAVLYRLGKADLGYEMGGRFRIRSLDDDNYVFRSKKGADTFAAIHGFQFVSERDMLALRDARKKLGE